jgi:hypothetical protein
MKQFLLLSLSVIALNACGTTSNTQTASSNQGDALSIDEIIQANEIEIAEMEQLTGQTIRFDNVTPPPSINDLALNVEEEDIDLVKAEELISIEKAEDTPSTTAKIEDIAKTEVKNVEPPIQLVEKTEMTTTETLNKQALEASKIAQQNLDKNEVQLTASEIENVTDNQSNQLRERITSKAQQAPIETAKIEKVTQQPNKLPATVTTQKTTTPKAQRASTTISNVKNCPKVEILPLARSLTLLDGIDYNNLVARSVIDDIRGNCTTVKGGVEVNLDLLMTGKIGEKGRFEGNEKLESFITFPYFLAVSNAQGQPIDKKILATAMRFKPIVDDLKHAEKITQFIPISNMTEADDYRILVGFQLNRKQLNYNRASTANTINNQRVAPDLKNQPRRSLNPLAE